MKDYLDALKIVSDLGGTVAIAVTVVVCAYKLLGRFGVPFISALEKIAVAAGDQAKNMGEVKVAVDKFVNKDNMEHREILLGMQVVGEELKSLACEVRSLRKEG